MNFRKRVAATVVCAAACGGLMPVAAYGQAIDKVTAQLSVLPRIYVKACYGWLKANYSIGDVTADQLIVALQQHLEKDGFAFIGNTSDQRVVDRALAWGKTADTNPQCGMAPIAAADVMTAVKDVQKDQANHDSKLKEDAKTKYWQEHANDPVNIDYAHYSQSIAGRSAKPRKPAGSVRKLIVSQYLAWEKKVRGKWLSTVIGAGSDVNVMQMHDQCKADIATQWLNSFGYADTVLKAKAFGNTVVTLDFAISAACATELLRAVGIPVTNEISRVGSATRS